jgi:peptidoglycan-associated lipoprotein
MVRTVIAVNAVLLLLMGAGCAKKPASSGASVPAPGGTTGATAGGMAAGGASGGAAGSTGQMSAGGSGPSGAGQRGAGGQAAGGTMSGAARPQPREFAAVADMQDVHFDFDRYDIRPGDARILDANARWLKANETHLVLIEGHCDERGTDVYNIALGERRAKATMNYLVAQGVQATRISVVSYGEERPSCRDRNEGCWAQNRRAHFLVKPR